MSEKKRWRLLAALLLFGSALAAIKLIFVDYTMDEEYQIVMAYRKLQGDNLFGTMWEPHQTSAFACIFLMRIFHALTGSYTGVVVFLRVCTTAVQVLFAVWLYRVLRRITESEYAFLISVCYFNIVPKLIEIPEFSNLQLWGFTMVILSLAERRLRGKDCFLVTAGLGMAVEVLAYPTDIILFPFFLAVLFAEGGKDRWRNTFTFAGTCALCALVWLLAVLSQVEPSEFIRNIGYILKFDLTHNLTTAAGGKYAAVLIDIVRELLLAALAFGIGVLVQRAMRGTKEPDRKQERLVLLVAAVLAAEGIQLVYWLILRKGYENPQIHLLVICIAAFLCRRLEDGRRKYLLPCLGGAALQFLSVLFMSDLSLFYAIPHALMGILACALVLVFALEKGLGREGARRLSLLFLCSLCAVSVFGKGFLLRAGKTESNTLLGLGGIMREGPAAGIVTNYMQAYVNDCDYEDFTAYVPAGTNCLIVTNMVGRGGTSPYLFSELSVSHFSIVDPTSYDERLLTYWELYPQKQPDVIVVDCWYGQLMEQPDNWIMQYIENDFGYTRVEEGRYVRFYFK